MRKRCANINCRKTIELDPANSSVVCPHCKVTCDIVKNEKCYGGIQLKYIPETEICSFCKERKPISNFKKDPCSHDYHYYWCKKCVSDNYKEYYKHHKKCKTKDLKGLPTIEKNAPLSSVLNHLIHVSKKGVYADTILQDSITKIKAELSEA